MNGKTNGNIAYLFHGRNLDENTWNDAGFYTGMIQQYWQNRNIIPPTVVTVSFGPIWLLTPKGGAPKSGLAETFVKEVIPQVEAKIGVPKSRILFGESMGGLNTLLIGLTHPGLFQKIASLCPAVYVGSPFAPIDEIHDFLKRTGADPKAVFGVIQIAKEYFANDQEWQKSSPLKMIDNVDPKAMTEMYLSVGLYDVYGNFEGNEILAQTAKARGIKIEWRPVYGGHCATDVSSLSEFLVR